MCCTNQNCHNLTVGLFFLVILSPELTKTSRSDGMLSNEVGTDLTDLVRSYFQQCLGSLGWPTGCNL